MHSVEPTLSALRNPLLRYVLATRPPFLTVTLAACLVGLACAVRSGIVLSPVLAIGTVLFALIAHAAVNVLNDYYDALNGTDGCNTERIFPFTGGSRFIQNGVLSVEQTAAYGASLLAATTAGGVWLMAMSGMGLLAIGAAGMLIGWAYSAPPLKLNSRGLGEPCVAAGFALVVAGTDYVQRGAFSWDPWIAGAAYALLVTNILYVNQFPDRRADESVGKRHWVVMLGPRRARWGYCGIAAGAYGWIALCVALGALPVSALVGLAPLPLSVIAGRVLWERAEQPWMLAPAIQMTIAAATVHGLLLAAALAWL